MERGSTTSGDVTARVQTCSVPPRSCDTWLGRRHASRPPRIHFLFVNVARSHASPRERKTRSFRGRRLARANVAWLRCGEPVKLPQVPPLPSDGVPAHTRLVKLARVTNGEFGVQLVVRSGGTALPRAPASVRLIEPSPREATGASRHEARSRLARVRAVWVRVAGCRDPQARWYAAHPWVSSPPRDRATLTQGTAGCSRRAREPRRKGTKCPLPFRFALWQSRSSSPLRSSRAAHP